MASNKLRTALLCLSMVLITYSAVDLWHAAGKRSQMRYPALGDLSIAAATPVPSAPVVLDPYDAPRGAEPPTSAVTTTPPAPVEQAVRELRPAIDRAMAKKRETPVRARHDAPLNEKREPADKAVVLAMTADTAVIGIRGSDGEVTTRLVRVGDRLAQYGEVTAIRLGQGEVATHRANIRVEY